MKRFMVYEPTNAFESFDEEIFCYSCKHQRPTVKQVKLEQSDLEINI